LLRITRGIGIKYIGTSVFFRGCFNKGLYYKYKGKKYTMEIVIITEKLLLDSFKNIEDDLGEMLN